MLQKHTSEEDGIGSLYITRDTSDVIWIQNKNPRRTSRLSFAKRTMIPTFFLTSKGVSLPDSDLSEEAILQPRGANCVRVCRSSRSDVRHSWAVRQYYAILFFCLTQTQIWMREILVLSLELLPRTRQQQRSPAHPWMTTSPTHQVMTLMC